MDPLSFVSQIREHYLVQFKAFVEGQRQSSSKGASEVKLRLSEESELFQRLYCVDFIKNDPPEIVELQPDRVLTFDPISGSFGNAILNIEALRWDDVVIEHDATEPLSQLATWFDTWFDPEDRRHDSTAALGNVIHSLLIRDRRISVDLGTAETDALWGLLDVLEKAGAKNLRISASRVEPPAP
jgi:hypothetical protein